MTTLQDNVVDSDYISKRYAGEQWKTGILRWFSTTDTNPSLSPNHIAPNDSLAYLTEMKKLGNSAVVTSATDIPNSVYSSLLRPLTDLSFLTLMKNIMFVRITFQAFDVTDINDTVNQNQTVNQYILNSLNNYGESHVASRFMNTLTVDWQPNFFRPSFEVNDYDMFQRHNTTHFPNNKGDESIGLNIGMESSDGINLYHMEERLNKIPRVRASVRQLINISGTVYAKAYPVMASAFITFQQ